MTWNIDELPDRLAGLLRAGDTPALHALVAEIAPQDVAHAVRHLSEAEAADLLKRLPDEYSADVLVELREDTREDVMELLTASEIAEVVEEMDSDDAADVLAELEDHRADEVVSFLEEDDRREIAQLLAYPEDTAGGIMQLEVVSVREDRTVGRATEKIRMAFADVKTDFYFVYVVDRAGKLVGRIPLPRLILASPDELIRNIMERETYRIFADTDQEEVAREFRKYNQPSAPVVDRDGTLLGRITHDDVADVILEEAEEDYSRLAGTHDDDLKEDSVYRKAGIRLPWLVTGLVGGILSAVVLAHFEAEIERVIALAFFVPVIMAMGGNVAIQSSAVMVRALAMGDTSPRDAVPRLLREVGVSVVTGTVCSTLMFLTSWIWFGDPWLGGVVATSMLCVILISTSVGALVPLTLERFKIDPALATGPFVTTSNDILGILIYLTLATRFLK